MSEVDLEKLRNIIIEAFPNSSVPKSINELGYGMLQEWDSLGNFALLILIEQKFGVEFTMKELTEIRSVKQILIRLGQN